ncbi:2'-5' RNA ligase family protein [Devosia aquimaris]|uniref:2'-5' RNA ligase family protein n=1 Tax=Devosia aquimaris TaxID=2866214 RepID=UPI001CD18523|nr:2'-5' RNA ligase family protein [Devosia sp. CJK-A8-3]
MAYSFCLTLDAATDAAVRSIWQQLAAEGICNHMVTLDYVPHVSLAVLDDEPPRETVEAALAAMRSVRALTVRLGGVRSFEGTTIAWLAVEGGDALEAMHSHLMAHLPIDKVRAHYQPGLWTPHVTLQMEGDVARGMAAISRSWPERRAARIDALDLVQVPPVVVLNRIRLQ